MSSPATAWLNKVSFPFMSFHDRLSFVLISMVRLPPGDLSSIGDCANKLIEKEQHSHINNPFKALF
jgi:hypothetical protein